MLARQIFRRGDVRHLVFDISVLATAHVLAALREHGVLNWVLLIYEAAMRNFADNESFDSSVIG
jgi:hypothetical protein